MEQERRIPEGRLAPVLDALGLEFLAGFLETELRLHPENLGAWIELGHVYTRAKRYEEGLAVDRELVLRAPNDSTVRYNLACSLALLNRTEEALDALEQAVALGYEDPEHLLADPDLAGLREEARFQEFVRGLAK
ncbi:MAG: TPR end-of-group domain-containing protein [Planctomycetota bacterium]